MAGVQVPPLFVIDGCLPPLCQSRGFPSSRIKLLNFSAQSSRADSPNNGVHWMSQCRCQLQGLTPRWPAPLHESRLRADATICDSWKRPIRLLPKLLYCFSIQGVANIPLKVWAKLFGKFSGSDWLRRGVYNACEHCWSAVPCLSLMPVQRQGPRESSPNVAPLMPEPRESSSTDGKRSPQDVAAS